MRPLDWLLFLLVGMGAYVLGFETGQTPRWRDWLLEGEGANLSLIVDSVDISETTLGQLGPGYPSMGIHVLSVKTHDGFVSSLPIADGALARIDWLEGADRKALPIHQLLPKIENTLFSYFRRDRFRTLHVIPFLWGLPALRGSETADFAKAKAGVRRLWPFLPLADFIGFAPPEVSDSPWELGVWNSLTPRANEKTQLVAQRAIVLGLILFDTPNTRKSGTLRWVQGLTESPAALAVWLKTGLGTTLIPTPENRPKTGIPRDQAPEAVTQFEMKLFPR